MPLGAAVKVQVPIVSLRAGARVLVSVGLEIAEDRTLITISFSQEEAKTDRIRRVKYFTLILSALKNDYFRIYALVVTSC